MLVVNQPGDGFRGQERRSKKAGCARWIDSLDGNGTGGYYYLDATDGRAPDAPWHLKMEKIRQLSGLCLTEELSMSGI